MQPSIQGSRESVVDRLRGFALLGVVIVNAPFLLTSSEGLTRAAMLTVLDQVAGAVIWVGFQAKAYLIFAFLFGFLFIQGPLVIAAFAVGLLAGRALCSRHRNSICNSGSTGEPGVC